MDNTQNIISAFGGGGGILLGTSSVLQNPCTILYLESEIFNIKVMVECIEKGRLDKAPVTTVWDEDICLATRGYTDLLTGIHPQRNWDTLRYGIKKIRPGWLFFGTSCKEGKEWFQSARVGLQEMGYTTREGLYNAIEVGASIDRKWLFVLGRLAQSGYPRLQIPSWYSNWCRCKTQMQEGVKELPIFPTEVYRPGEPRLQSAFPAYPGYGQYDWEATRGVEPRVVGTTDGVPSRVDSLSEPRRENRIRLLGDEVVSQQAALALLTLLPKFKE